jgi:hypothetical protein
MERNLYCIRNGFEPHFRMAPCQIFTLPNTRRERALQSACHSGNQAVAGVSLLVEPVREKTSSTASGNRRPAGKGRAVVFIEVEGALFPAGSERGVSCSCGRHGQGRSVVCALSSAGAIFLVLELDTPFAGLGIFKYDAAERAFALKPDRSQLAVSGARSKGQLQ